MNTIIIISAIVAVAFAGEGAVDFSEDTSGNYRLNYNTKEASRTEQRSQDGRVIGSYSFFDTDGVKHTVTYVASENEGFKAQGASIPVETRVPVPEGHEILQARAEHLAAVAQEQVRSPYGVPTETPVNVHDVLSRLTVPQIASLPSHFVPAEDPENAAAKAELLAAYAKDLARLAQEYNRS